MIVAASQLQLPVRQLYALANSSFEPAEFKESCDSFARLRESYSFDDLWHFTFKGGEFHPVNPSGSPADERLFFGEGSRAQLIVGVNVDLVGREPGGNPVCRQNFVECAILSICWWETFSRCDHKTSDSWHAEQQAFNRVFEDALATTVNVLGPATIDGQDDDEHAHRYSIWQGTTALLVLQQSCYDPQFGLDINYWIRPWIGPVPPLSSPFIDWLCHAPYWIG